MRKILFFTCVIAMSLTMGLQASENNGPKTEGQSVETDAIRSQRYGEGTYDAGTLGYNQGETFYFAHPGKVVGCSVTLAYRGNNVFELLCPEDLIKGKKELIGEVLVSPDGSYNNATIYSIYATGK